ncbi:hypothetical protein ACFLUL_00995 [Chloroflexota bacterium]
MQGRSWKNIDDSIALNVKSYLLNEGGIDAGTKNPHESWRVKLSDATFTYYFTGTLYSTPSNSNDPVVTKAWRWIDSIGVSAYITPTKDYLIGLDETGKGEVIGHTILTGVIIPRVAFEQLDLLVGTADTKTRHPFEYWDAIFKELDRFKGSGFDFEIEKVPPWHVDQFNLNKIMDVGYQRILSIFLRRAAIEQCRIVLDDYGIGKTLNRFLHFLEMQGAEVVVTSRAEDSYLEAKIASLVSKRTREAVIKAINANPEFRINGLSVGAGNAGNPQTLEWLNQWYKIGKPFPWFVKRSFQTIRKIRGEQGKVWKRTPPIREELLSEEFVDDFNKGNLSIQSLSLVCPDCGNILKGAAFAMYSEGRQRLSDLKCPNTDCNRFIKDAGLTLRYYCGYVIPDSSTIQRSFLSNDLTASRFFENFNVILVPEVRKECDGTPRGRRELAELARYDAMSRIRFESVGRVEDVPNNLPNVVRDERIVGRCLEYNAIMLTADKSMYSVSTSKNIFTIFI